MRHPSLRAAVLLACADPTACQYARPDPAPVPGIPDGITSGSGGGERALHNQVDVGVTIRTGPAR